VLAAAGSNTYNDFSDLDHILGFAGLQAPATSYSEDDFTLSSNGILLPDTSLSAAVRAGFDDDLLTLRALRRRTSSRSTGSSSAATPT